MTEEELPTDATFQRLMEKSVRVLFREGPEARDKVWVWFGILTKDVDGFVELSDEGQCSYVNKRYIIAISGVRDRDTGLD